MYEGEGWRTGNKKIEEKGCGKEKWELGKQRGVPNLAGLIPLLSLLHLTQGEIKGKQMKKNFKEKLFQEGFWPCRLQHLLKLQRKLPVGCTG